MMHFDLVIGDECRMYKDLSLALLGRVKEFASLTNLKIAIGNEGFADIIIKYMGEMWVMQEFQSMETLNEFRKNVSIASWFSQNINASSDFETEGRISWVEIEGVSFKLWSGKTFCRIASKWGKILDVDDQEDNFETAGWVPDFTEKNDDDDHDDLNSNKDGSDILRSGDVGNFKTGFDTGYDSEEEAVQETFFEKEESVNRLDEEDKVDSHMDKHGNSNIKEAENEASSLGHFKKLDFPKTDGSILGLLEEVVKVGQVMGYNMEGCISNIGEIISSKGVEEQYQ
nr:nucleotide-binding alpha-beta plait domain-containing protein [Tanacetum cinerariifolium]